MLQMTSVNIEGDFKSTVSLNMDKNDIIINIESERVVIASVIKDDARTKSTSLLKCEEQSTDDSQLL